MADTGAEHQPRAAVGAVPDDLVDGGFGHRLDVDRRLELAGDELAAAAADAARVQLRRGPLRHHLAEVALRDHLGDARLVGDVGEQRAVALVQHAAVEPVGRRGEADHLEVRVDRREIAQEAAVHGVRGARDKVRLIDQRQIAALDVVGALVDALDAGEQDLRVQIALVQPGRVDAGRRVRPQPDHLAVVLRDQLLDVGDDENPRVGPVGDGARHERGNANRLFLSPLAARSADCRLSRRSSRRSPRWRRTDRGGAGSCRPSLPPRLLARARARRSFSPRDRRSRFLLTRPQPQQPGGEDLADLGEAFGGGHPVGVEGVRGHA